MLADIIRRCRTIRRFKESETISRETVLELVDAGRLSASGGNVQPLKYWISCDPKTNARVFPHLAWAGYMKDWPGPEEGQRPAAYVVIVGDKDISESYGMDPGISAQSMALLAAEKGIGTCMIGSIQRVRLQKDLEIPETYEILLVLAFGVPDEEVVLEETGADGDIKYYRDEQSVHHVPKRPLADVVIN